MVSLTVSAVSFFSTLFVIVSLFAAYLTRSLASTVVFVVAVLLASEAAKGLWNICTDGQPQVASCYLFWKGVEIKRHDKYVC